MLKKQLIKETSLASGHSEKSTREILDALEVVVLNAVAAGRSVMLAGLGKLVISRRGPKRARNLHTGATVVVPERNVVLLRPSDGLLQAANQEG